MNGMDDILSAAEALPVQERALLVDFILKTLNKPDPDVDRQWLIVAQQRLEELRAGDGTPIPGDEVFEEIQDRFSQ